MRNVKVIEKKVVFVVTVVSLCLLLVYMFQEQISFLYNPENHLGFHTVLEFFSIFVSFSIFTFGWKTFPFTKSRSLLLLSLTFFAVGSIDLIHTLTYEGMPIFITESSVQKATWFWILARVVETTSVLAILLLPDKVVVKDNRNKYLTYSLLIIASIIMIVFTFEKSLPLLVIKGQGTTALKNGIEYSLAFLNILSIGYVVRSYMKDRKELNIYLAVAFWFILISEITFTLYHSVYDVNNFIGHLFKVVGYIYIMKGFYFSTIDDAKAAEQKAIKVQKELSYIMREQQGMIFTVVKEADRFIHKLCDGEFLYSLGYSPEKIIGKTIEEYVKDKNKATIIDSYYKQTWNTGEKTTFELYAHDKYIYTSLKPVIEEGRVIEIIGSVIDITEVKQMEEMLRNTEKLSLVGQLSAGFAHEIKNPMTTLKGFLQMMNLEVDEKRQPVIELMLSEVQRIETITKDLMNIARPMPINFQQDDVTEVLKEVINFMRSSARMKNVEILFHYEEKMEMICERNKLKQVFINMIQNAVDAMPNGGNLYISIKQNNSSNISLCFKDEGIGIPEDKLEKVGQPFYTSKETGNGLGLMMSKKIIEDHHGEMEVESEVGKGTTFIISLPILEERIALSI